MKNKIVLITGSTDGIGKQTAIDLAALGAHVIIHGREEKRVDETIKRINRITNNGESTGFICDLSYLNNVRLFAEEVKEKFDHVDVLINNAGVYMKERTMSEDGYEMTFAVNYLAHFLLTNELLPLIQKNSGGRIVHVSSVAHERGVLDFANLNGEKKFSAYGAYALSKLACVLFSNELAERLDGTNVTSNSLHPGVITTKLLRTGFDMSGSSVKEGAETSVYLASSPDVKNISGKYFNEKRATRYHSIVDDIETRKKFWDISAKMVGLI